jgi:parvulin-like peptidyl-prolyl isomerase
MSEQLMPSIDKNLRFGFLIKSVAGFVVFILLVCNYQIISQTNSPDSSQIVATIGTLQIPAKDFTERLENFLVSAGIKDNIIIRRSILNNMINEMLLYNYDDNKKIFANTEYQKELKWSDRQVVLAYLRDQEVYAKIPVTEDEIREAYLRVNEKIAARHLFAKTKEEANSLYQLLQTGADFNLLAKQVFTDTTLQNNGGYLGYFTWGDFDPAFEDAAYALKVGEISKPVKTAQGYSIIKLEDRVTNPLITENEFANKKQHMYGVIRLRKKASAEKEFNDRVFNENKVWFNEKLIEDIWDNMKSSMNHSSEINKYKYSNKVCVKYGKKSFTQIQLEKRIDEIPLFHKEKITSFENLKAAVKGIILQDILYSMAVEKGYDNYQGVKDIIPKYRQTAFLEYKNREVRNNVVLPDSVIEAFYKTNPKYFSNPDQINVQEIIVNSKQLVDSLNDLVHNGTDFGTIAEKYSLRKWSALNKGVMGLDEVSKFGMLKDTLWNSEINKVIGPMNIQDKFGLFKVLEKKTGEVKEFKTVKKEAEQMAKDEKSKQILEDYTSALRSKVIVNVNEKLLGDIVLEN